MLEVDVERGEVVYAQAVNLRYVIFIAGDSAGGWGAG